MTTVLGIEVDDDLMADWRRWFAPPAQLFALERVPQEDRTGLAPVDLDTVPLELRDTAGAYTGEWVLLDEARWRALARDVRRAMVAARDKGYRTVWWPGTLQAAGDGPIVRLVEDGCPPSRHDDVAKETWTRASTLLPEARRLAGTFARGSGPNCFGTVMAAAGVPGAEHEWMAQPAFEDWLAANATPVRGPSRDDEPGVVYVWRRGDGLATHAAATLGDGWSLNKPAQGWWAPRFVWPRRTTISLARQPGCRLHRYVMRRGV